MCVVVGYVVKTRLVMTKKSEVPNMMKVPPMVLLETYSTRPKTKVDRASKFQARLVTLERPIGDVTSAIQLLAILGVWSLISNRQV